MAHAGEDLFAVFKSNNTRSPWEYSQAVNTETVLESCDFPDCTMLDQERLNGVLGAELLISQHVAADQSVNRFHIKHAYRLRHPEAPIFTYARNCR